MKNKIGIYKISENIDSKKSKENIDNLDETIKNVNHHINKISKTTDANKSKDDTDTSIKKSTKRVILKTSKKVDAKKSKHDTDNSDKSNKNVNNCINKNFKHTDSKKSKVEPDTSINKSTKRATLRTSKKVDSKKSKDDTDNSDKKINKKRKENFIDYNKYNGRKKYFKISTITDSYGTPLASTIVSSKQSDNISVEETVDNIPVNLNTLRNSKINRYKQYFLGDSGYHSKSNIKYLKGLGYIPIIAYNKRNCKNKETIIKNKLNGKNKTIYKKRMIVESYFSWIKRFPLINQNYQKTIRSYKGLLTLANIMIIAKRI
jgi:hypothetical protein